MPIVTSQIPKIEVLSGPERRRRGSTAEKLTIVQETYEPDATVSIVARRYGIQPNQLFTWRKLANQGALTATAALLWSSQTYAGARMAFEIGCGQQREGPRCLCSRLL